MPNPYAPPNEANATITTHGAKTFKRGQKKGPALYIVVCGLLGGIIGSPFLIRYTPVGLVLPLVGCAAGGIVYRIRATDWPIDPTARSRQWRYILAVMTLLPGTIFLFSGVRAQGAGIVMIGAIVGLAVSSGIIASGTRRHAEES